MKFAAALCFLALVVASNALTNETAVTESVKISSMLPSAFVYNPIASNNLMVQSHLLSVGSGKGARELNQQGGVEYTCLLHAR